MPLTLFKMWSYGSIRITSNIDHCMQVQYRLSEKTNIYLYIYKYISISIYLGHAWVDLGRFGDDFWAIGAKAAVSGNMDTTRRFFVKDS